MTNPDHPGTIAFVDMSRGTRREVRVHEIPEEQRFVHLRDGIAVGDPGQATECVPVVLVEMAAFDASGKLIATPEAAAKVRITEYGPEGRMLRETLMAPSRAG